jgi:hypothetical protein
MQNKNTSPSQYLENYNEMWDEWQMWQTVVKLWPDINDPKFGHLVRAIQLWGECLVTLRVKQTPEVRASALAMAANRERLR